MLEVLNTPRVLRSFQCPTIFLPQLTLDFDSDSDAQSGCTALDYHSDTSGANRSDDDLRSIVYAYERTISSTVPEITPSPTRNCSSRNDFRSPEATGQADIPGG